MNTSAPTKRSPLKFIILTFALAIPFWVIGAGGGSLSAGPLSVLPSYLPVGALQAFCPLIAALILVYREDKFAGIRKLLERVLDLKRIRSKIWYVPIIFLGPVVALLSYVMMSLLGLLLPEQNITFHTVPILFVLFFIGAIGEEAGWTGYVTDPMQDRWSALTASIILGFVWAIFHLVPLLEFHRPLAWIAWWALGTVALRILIVWLYNNTGKSVFAAVLFHAIFNVSGSLLPNNGNPDPAISGSILAIAAVIVTFLWGRETLARFRYASRAA